MHPGKNIDTERVIWFLDGLHQMIEGPVWLIWDNISTHHSILVQQYLVDNEDWLHVAYLPAYSPHLNPIEYLWSAWKRTYLANLCETNASRLCDVLMRNEAQASDPQMLKGCILASGLVAKEDEAA